jgi:hypothetical protein
MAQCRADVTKLIIVSPFDMGRFLYPGLGDAVK